MDFRKQVGKAIRLFWQVRTKQHKQQVSATGRKDAGNRSAVTGGKHLDGFRSLLFDLLVGAGIPRSDIHLEATTLPGYFRATKNWDLVVVVDGILLASIELKSHIGPAFGNNFNNRVEEALGNSQDLLTAYREGKFKPAQRPWLGWLMLLEETRGSQTPVRVDEPHFAAFPEFHGASYAKRYELFCERLQRERLYDSACLILTDRTKAARGQFTEPNAEFSFTRFAVSLTAHAMAFAQSRRL